MPGYVLVTAEGSYDNVVSAPGGTKFFVDTEFDPERHRTTVGRVVAVSDVSGDIGFATVFQWLGPIEVAPGDRVHFHYHSVTEDSCYLIGGERCWRIPYAHLIARVDGDGAVEPLCGRILVERGRDERVATRGGLTAGGIIIPGHSASQSSETRGVVRHVHPDVTAVAPGDEVFFREIAADEYEIAGAPYLCMYEDDILALA